MNRIIIGALAGLDIALLLSFMLEGFRHPFGLLLTSAAGGTLAWTRPRWSGWRQVRPRTVVLIALLGLSLLLFLVSPTYIYRFLTGQ